MERSDVPQDAVTCYLTTEQIHRLAGIACDALVGCQIHTDASDETYVTVDMVPIDSRLTDMGDAYADMEHYTIYSDGSYRRTT